MVIAVGSIRPDATVSIESVSRSLTIRPAFGRGRQGSSQTVFSRRYSAPSGSKTGPKIVINPRLVDISASRGHIVPTAITYRSDLDAFFVGNLGRLPADPGSAMVLRIGRDGSVAEWATTDVPVEGHAHRSRSAPISRPPSSGSKTLTATSICVVPAARDSTRGTEPG
jgi:hypothetical protein